MGLIRKSNKQSCKTLKKRGKMGGKKGGKRNTMKTKRGGKRTFRKMTKGGKKSRKKTKKVKRGGGTGMYYCAEGDETIDDLSKLGYTDFNEIKVKPTKNDQFTYYIQGGFLGGKNRVCKEYEKWEFSAHKNAITNPIKMDEQDKHYVNTRYWGRNIKEEINKKINEKDTQNAVNKQFAQNEREEYNKGVMDKKNDEAKRWNNLSPEDKEAEEKQKLTKEIQSSRESANAACRNKEQSKVQDCINAINKCSFKEDSVEKKQCYLNIVGN
jgi:hypothetical protein